MKIKVNKKLILIILVIFVLLLTVSLVFYVKKIGTKSPVTLTEEYMQKYQNLNKEIVDSIVYEFDDDLTDVQKNKYKEIMKKQYSKMTYEIMDEVVNETDAIITVEFDVYDLSAAMEMADSYVDVYSDRFMKNGKFDNYAAIDYKLKSLSNCTERIAYSIKFTYYKKDKKWILSDLSDVDLKKLNGTY